MKIIQRRSGLTRTRRQLQVGALTVAGMLAGRAPASIAEFEQLAEYGLSSAWRGLHALQEVQHGRLRWEDWLPLG